MDSCCEDMAMNIRDCKTVQYNEVFDEYGLAVPGDEHSLILLDYCPWCGKKLPESRRGLWFEELESLGFDAPLIQAGIPEEYKCAKWREKA